MLPARAALIRTVLWLLATTAVGGLALTAHNLHAILNPHPAEVGNPDAIAVFAGNSDRLRRAIELYQDELTDPATTPTLVISLGADWQRGVDVETKCAALQTLVSARAGRSVNTICTHPDPVTTRGEAAALAHLVNQRGWDDVVGVSSSYHSHRVGLWLRQCFGDDIQLRVVAADADNTLRLVTHELGGSLHAQLLDRSCPSPPATPAVLATVPYPAANPGPELLATNQSLTPPN